MAQLSHRSAGILNEASLRRSFDLQEMLCPFWAEEKSLVLLFLGKIISKLHVQAYLTKIMCKERK